jgi:hydrogenase nickel incorporation protein HypA/HybF
MTMHELSLVEGVLALVEEERRLQGFTRVRVIRLRVGALACVELDALRFCFEAMTLDAADRGARLEIDEVPGLGWCAACRQTVPLAHRLEDCPICGNPDVPVTGGGDLRLAELEVD